jgi:aminoglycoside phosphotransferase (APT) family kinase protein
VIGAPFVVSEYRDGGLVIFGEAPPSMAGLPDLGMRLAAAMADALAALHRVDYAAIGLADLGKPEGFVERQVAGWRDRWQRVAAGECSARYVAMGAWLADEMPQSGPAALVHNDYKLDNCQFRPGAPDKVVSVFDWDMATLGDPLVDVGICLAYWPHMRRAPSLGLPDGEVFARLYARRMGIDPAALRWYEAFANWRTGVAVQQLYNRFASGNSADKRLANVGRSVVTFLERAEAVMAGARQ